MYIPLVVLPGDNSATKVGVLQTPSVDATMSDGAKFMSDDSTCRRKRKTVTFESGAKHSAKIMSHPL